MTATKTMDMPEVFIIDPKDGRRLRAATSDEQAAFMAQTVRFPAHFWAFARPVAVPAGLVDFSFGPMDPASKAVHEHF